MTTTTRCCCCFFVLVATLLLAEALRSPSGSGCRLPKLKNGRFRPRGREGRIGRYSCFSDYVLVGNKYTTCQRGEWDTPTPICVSARCSDPPVPEHAVVGKKFDGAILMYFCEPGYLLVGNSEIYCDGQQWNATVPYCRDSDAPLPTSCDFEKDVLCWWEQDPRHDFDWIRHNYDTPSAHINTGPSHDHTLGPGYDGHYLYTEASGRLLNDKARIISPLYPARLTESGCFSFWYHMYGSTIGTLNVYFKPETQAEPEVKWTKEGNQGNHWLRGMFPLPPVNTSFQIIIEGVRGTSYISDIAIDDVAILQGEDCNVKITSFEPSADIDEIELSHAMQSCKGRCVNGTWDSLREEASPSLGCQCTLDCSDNANCCPDFALHCLYEMPEQPDNSSSEAAAAPQEPPPPPAVTSAESEAATVTMPPTINSTTIGTSTGTASTATSKSSSLSSETATTTFTPTTTTAAAAAAAAVNTTTTATTSVPFTTTTTTAITTTTTNTTAAAAAAKTAATAKQTMATRSTIIKLTTNGATWKIPAIGRAPRPTIAKKTSETGAAAIAAAADEPVQSQLERTSGLGVAGVVAATFGCLAVLASATTLVFLFVVKYRRSNYKRRSNTGGGFSEDSDVRFLTSDEALDFNLAKPADESPYDRM
ncbi:uncharacterized protein LOC106658313 [Trichogramma pretiosum]|uniref:uncharacterized protein LOC106658313 n=1 Tax=Trichogramma pretiosum TaxID=7493 RepID=UPI000C719435|nr:uncharacterized protein LOC106658313 [Trichogramma pretiosum]